ncbi:MAG: lytic transglycosylase domain-containing protein [Pseudomonadota bacterium]
MNKHAPLNSKRPRRWLAVFLFVLTVHAKASANDSVGDSNKKHINDALTQAVTHPLTGRINLDELVWISTMSERLEKRLSNPFYRVRLLKNLRQEAKAAGLDPQLVLAVIEVESSFQRNAVSKSGALGLMQIMPFWKDVYGRPQDNLFNPLVNLRYGCNILRHYLDRYGNVEDALAAYNGSLGKEKYPRLVLSRYRKNWRYALAEYDSVSYAANTLPRVNINDSVGTLVHPNPVTLIAKRSTADNILLESTLPGLSIPFYPSQSGQ